MEERDLVYSIATIYPNYTRIYTPHVPYPKNREKGEISVKVRSDDLEDYIQEDNLERAARRAKKAVYDYSRCNYFDLFVTFTFAEDRVGDRFNMLGLRRKLMDWVKNQQKRYGKFEYLIVMELHENGGIHFHALFKNYQGPLDRAINPNTGKPFRNSYNLTSYTLGFTQARKIHDTDKDRVGTSAYLAKYITKDMPLLPGKKRYWVSTGLAMPAIEINPAPWYVREKAIWEISTPMGRVAYYSNFRRIDWYEEATK